jgi:hypothetical protein
LVLVIDSYEMNEKSFWIYNLYFQIWISPSPNQILAGVLIERL